MLATGHLTSDALTVAKTFLSSEASELTSGKEGVMMMSDTRCCPGVPVLVFGLAIVDWRIVRVAVAGVVLSCIGKLVGHCASLSTCPPCAPHSRAMTYAGQPASGHRAKLNNGRPHHVCADRIVCLGHITPAAFSRPGWPDALAFPFVCGEWHNSAHKGPL